MPEITLNLTYEMIDKIVLDELLDWWKINEKEIASLLEREKEATLPLYKKADLEDSLDLRSHLKAVIKYCTHINDRKKLNLPW